MPRDAYIRLRPLIALARSLAGPLVAVALVTLATAVRAWLTQHLPGLAVFSLYYPAILASALFGGQFAAAIALGLSTGIGWSLLTMNPGSLGPASIHVNVLLFAASGAFIGVVGAVLRNLLRRRRADFLRLADREARYRALFDGVAEGFALLEAVRENGEVVDFIVIEANPAVLKMFGHTQAIIGRRQSAYREPITPDYFAACKRALAGEAVRLEADARRIRRWFEIRMSRVDERMIAQIIVDITDQKATESHKIEMFNELNHRVKNNLAAVSAMLSMQARAAQSSTVREQLQKAVDRIETIGDVHASLYRASSTGDVDFSGYLQKLCARLSASLLDGERVQLEVAADPVTAPLEEAVALGLIVNELVTNAAKHAYPPPAHGVIRVTLSNSASGLALSVRDDGRGLRQDDTPSGIGMRLVRSLVQQCRGELVVENEGGASFTVRLPQHGAQPTRTAQSQLL